MDRTDAIGQEEHRNSVLRLTYQKKRSSLRGSRREAHKRRGPRGRGGQTVKAGRDGSGTESEAQASRNGKPPQGGEQGSNLNGGKGKPNPQMA